MCMLQAVLLLLRFCCFCCRPDGALWQMYYSRPVESTRVFTRAVYEIHVGYGYAMEKRHA